MLVMPANNTGIQVGYLAGRYPGMIGHLYGPGGACGPFGFMPYGLENGRYPAWEKKREWDRGAFVALLDRYRYCGHRPLWAAVPDVVTDRAATLASWAEWVPLLRPYGFPLAFVVQDGMAAADVPAAADVVFVGGSTEWKWRTLRRWCADFPRVHVGRVNGYSGLWQCHDAGAESCDGTGWFRGDQQQLDGLYRYLAEASGERRRPTQAGLWGAA